MFGPDEQEVAYLFMSGHATWWGRDTMFFASKLYHGGSGFLYCHVFVFPSVVAETS